MPTRWGEVYSGTFVEQPSKGGRWVRCLLVLDRDDHMHVFLSPDSQVSLVVLPMVFMTVSQQPNTLAGDCPRSISLRMAKDLTAQETTEDAALPADLVKLTDNLVTPLPIGLAHRSGAQELAEDASWREGRGDTGAQSGSEDEDGVLSILQVEDAVVLMSAMHPTTALGTLLAQGREVALRFCSQEVRQEWLSVLEEIPSAADNHLWTGT